MILDEPTTDLDPSVRTEFSSIVREMVAAATRVLSRAGDLERADPVSVVVGGEIFARGAPSKLKRESVLRGLATPFASVSGYSTGGGSASGSTSIVPPDVESVAVELHRIESVVAREGIGVVFATLTSPSLDKAIVRPTLGGGR